MAKRRKIIDERLVDPPEKQDVLNIYHEGLARIGEMSQPVEILLIWETVEVALAKAFRRGILNADQWGELDLHLARKVKAKADILPKPAQTEKVNIALTEQEIQEIESLNDKGRREKAKICYVETVARMEAVGRSAALFELCTECEVKLLAYYIDSPDKRDDFGKWHYLLSLRLRKIIMGEG